MEELAETISEREFRHHSLPVQERYQLMVEEHPDLLERAPHSGQSTRILVGGLSPQRSQGLKGRTASTPIINERLTRSLTVRLSQPKTGGSNGQ